VLYLKAVLHISQSAENNTVGIAASYELEGPGIESQWRAILSVRVQTFPKLLHSGYRVVPGSTRLRCDVDHLPPSNAEVKERVQLQLYSPSVPSLQVIG
jgi:hypothetical protein